MKKLLEYIDEAIVKKPRTNDYNGIYNVYKPIDLGLSVKWANCNVGAKKPEDPGLLFQWGRTDGYKYGYKKHSFLGENDYVTTSGKDYAAGDTLDLKDDAAAINMGGEWRMPTQKEFEELINGTKHEFNGKYITLIAENGNSIIIPYTGYYGGNFWDLQHIAAYWTSSVSLDKWYFSNGVWIYIDKISADKLTIDHQYYGFGVRGVL